MPTGQQGFNITGSEQIAPGVIVDSDVDDAAAIAQSKLALAITDAEVDSAAAIAMSKLALAITNAQVAAGAGIVASKLATISTAGKVSGAALTLLPNIPSGAGVIPAANVPPPSTLLHQTVTNVTPAGGDDDNLFSFSLAGGKLSTGNAVRITGYFEATIATGALPSIFKLIYGSTTLVTLTLTQEDNTSTVYRGKIEATLFAAASASAQEAHMIVHGMPTQQVTAGSPSVMYGAGAGTASENSANALTLRITGNNSNAGDITITSHHWVVESMAA